MSGSDRLGLLTPQCVAARIFPKSLQAVRVQVGNTRSSPRGTQRDTFLSTEWKLPKWIGPSIRIFIRTIKRLSRQISPHLTPNLRLLAGRYIRK